MWPQTDNVWFSNTRNSKGKYLVTHKYFHYLLGKYFKLQGNFLRLVVNSLLLEIGIAVQNIKIESPIWLNRGL